MTKERASGERENAIVPHGRTLDETPPSTLAAGRFLTTSATLTKSTPPLHLLKGVDYPPRYTQRYRYDLGDPDQKLASSGEPGTSAPGSGPGVDQLLLLSRARPPYRKPAAAAAAAASVLFLWHAVNVLGKNKTAAAF